MKLLWFKCDKKKLKFNNKYNNVRYDANIRFLFLG